MPWQSSLRKDILFSDFTSRDVANMFPGSGDRRSLGELYFESKLKRKPTPIKYKSEAVKYLPDFSFPIKEKQKAIAIGTDRGKYLVQNLPFSGGIRRFPK
jgi:hypothetical protein